MECTEKGRLSDTGLASCILQPHPGISVFSVPPWLKLKLAKV